MVAKTTATVLITGESGTGKELITRAIHSRSGRSRKPLVAINCAALAETLLESELFGHEKGAFTGATLSKRGLIEEADGGTLFLDEISEMPLSFQVKLLRVMQNGEFKRVGSSQTRTADIRTIVATNRPLEPLVQKGTFREDLYHRINQFQIHIPSLRERIEDLSLLSQFFLESACKESRKPLVGFSPTLVQKMHRYSWPGNVRELQSMISQAVILATPPLVELKDMPMLIEKLYKNPRKTRLSDMSYAEAKEEFEKRYFQSLIDRTEGNISAASRMCRVERKHLREKVRSLGIVGAASSQKHLRT
jgi:two-component system response regulator HydG